MLLLTRSLVRRPNGEVQDLRRTKDHAGDRRRNRPPVAKCTANRGKTNRFAPFKGHLPFREGHAPLFASGMAARKGEDPLAGLQRSLQPGPQGTPTFFEAHNTRFISETAR
jgi:hypothetical protein